MQNGTCMSRMNVSRWLRVLATSSCLGCVYFSPKRWLRDGVSLASHLALYGSHPHRLHVHSLVSQPQACVHMLYVADRVSILDLRGSHAIDFLSHPCIQFFLRREEKEIIKFLKYDFILKELGLVVNMFLEKFSPLKSPEISQIFYSSSSTATEDLSRKL